MRSSPRKKQSHRLKLVNQGSYGCIYRPSMRCGPGRLRAAARDGGAYLSKLQKDGRAAKTEIAIGAKVAKLPRFAQRFAPVISACPVVRKQIPTGEPAFRDCKALQDKNRGGDKFMLMKMPVAGSMTIAEYLRGRQRSTGRRRRTSRDEDEDDENENDENDEDAQFTNRLADLYHVLRDSLSLLASASVVHNDLKDNNIMYHAEKHAPVIIDFGLSLDVAALLRNDTDAALWRDTFYAYQPDYVAWCPESVLCSALWRGTARESRPPKADAAAAATATNVAEGGAAQDKDETERRADDVLGAEEIAALGKAMTTCFSRHPTLLAVRARRAPDVEAKLHRTLQQVQALQGLTRMDAARRVLESSWRRWDRFALAGVLLPYRRSAATFWNQVDADVLA